jgi:hypothetical protein
MLLNLLLKVGSSNDFIAFMSDVVIFNGEVSAFSPLKIATLYKKYIIN